MNQPTKLIDSYEMSMAPMQPEHLEQLCALSVAVRWPQRLNDWQMVQALGEGVVALDEIGRLVGSAMMFPMGAGPVQVGMVITSPRLQERGTGRWLMNEIMRRSEGRSRMLNATKESYRLYFSLGFTPVGQVWQQQGIARALPGQDPRVRSGTAADHSALHILDRRAFGCDRAPVLDYVLACSELTVLEDRGRIQGFALCRAAGRGHVLGPVIARSQDEAVALIRPLIAAHAGAFMRMDTRHSGGALQSALETAGLAHYDNAMTMILGHPPEPDPEVQTFGLVSQAFS